MEQTLPLRDIHLPQDVGWWPPAIGWWVLTLLALLCVYFTFRAYRYFTRRTATTDAVRLLDSLCLAESIPPLEKVRQLSSLLRRVAISTDSRSEVAGLHGIAWLGYLDQSVPGTPFTQGPGRMLAQGPFRQDFLLSGNSMEEQEILALMQLSRQWIKAQE